MYARRQLLLASARTFLAIYQPRQSTAGRATGGGSSKRLFDRLRRQTMPIFAASTLWPSSLGRTPETPIRLPIGPAPRAWGQRWPRARACGARRAKSRRGAKKVHKNRRRAPERARIAGNSETHLFVWAILTLDRMVSCAHSAPPRLAKPLTVSSNDQFSGISAFFQFFGWIVLTSLLVEATPYLKKYSIDHRK